MTDTNTPTESTVFAQRHATLVRVLGDEYVQKFQSPVVFIKNATLNSPAAIRFFKKDFGFLSKGLYLDYQYRSWVGYNQEVLERFTSVINGKLDKIKTLLVNNNNRFAKLLADNNYSPDDSYFPNSITLDVPIIAGQARAYFELLQLLDQLTALATAANLYGVIDASQRNTAETLCRRAVRAFRSVLQGECVKLYAEAGRVIRAQKEAGHDSPDMAAVHQKQGEDIAAFEKASAEDAVTDPGMDLGGMDPSDLIDHAAAASTAVGTGKKTTRKTASPQADLVTPN